MTITLLHYTPQDYEERQLSTPDEAAAFLNRPGVLWLHIAGLDDQQAIERLGEMFRLHPLALEDVLSGPQRPKAEEYEEQDFVVTHAVTQDEHTHRLKFHQFAIFVGDNYLISLHEHDTEVVEHVRERIRTARGLIRSHGVDHLMYSLLDGLIDDYFPILEEFGEYLERLQDEALLLDYPSTLRDIQRAKHELLHLRRVVWPQRDLLNVLMRDDNNTVSGPVRHYLRDCYDHVVQLIDMIETYREMSSDLMDAYMSAISNRTNAVMKVLTIIATIFMPLTFIVGLYGMNFNTKISTWNMPELNWKYGYMAIWAVMIIVTVLMLLYFRRRGWIGRADVPTEKDLEPDEAGIPPQAP